MNMFKTARILNPTVNVDEQVYLLFLKNCTTRTGVGVPQGLRVGQVLDLMQKAYLKGKEDGTKS